ncbi:MAG: 4'-phosphopantetheinyl transferase superfamily protein [Lachnospiraceae bacterium]|nr:4'-phosphopantetheinyl transferase superfamily protein [Lachnospiraceae bacterium]
MTFLSEKTDHPVPARIYISTLPLHPSRQLIRKQQIPMLRRALEEFGFHPDDRHLNVMRSEHGKPWLPDFHGFHYNFSDSGNYLLLAASTVCEVGVDLQEIRTPHGGILHFAKRFFPEEDLLLLKALESDEPQQELLFSRIWSIREAYLKYTGAGLGGGIGSFPIDFDLHTAGEASFTEISVPEGYTAAICWK